jgi:hypothetical protein
MTSLKKGPLLPRKEYYRKVLRSFIYAGVLIAGSLLIGVLGYHFICDLPWVDALLNSSMILTGMGPVDPMRSEAAKIFASFYALFSGIAFLTTVAVFLAPMVHRFLHKFHLEDGDDN